MVVTCGTQVLDMVIISPILIFNDMACFHHKSHSKVLATDIKLLNHMPYMHPKPQAYPTTHKAINTECKCLLTCPTFNTAVLEVVMVPFHSPSS